MHKVDLRNYGDLWTELIAKIKETNPYFEVFASSTSVKFHLKYFYGIDVHVTPNAKIGEVYMMPQEYTAFLLKWG